jgi:energy-converting hydrogenase B subunit D
MRFVQVVVLLLVAAGATVVVLTREPIRQAILVGMFGLALTGLFVVFHAPDVALSMVAVGAVALPLMILLAVGKTRERDE